MLIDVGMKNKQPSRNPQPEWVLKTYNLPSPDLRASSITCNLMRISECRKTILRKSHIIQKTYVLRSLPFYASNGFTCRQKKTALGTLHNSVVRVCIRPLLFLVKEDLGTDHLTWRGGVMFFCFVQNLFFGQHKSWNIYFFCRAKCEFFFQNLTLCYMTKTLNQIIFFPPPKSEYFFLATLGIRIFL